MSNIKEAIKDYFEARTYSSSSEFTYNYRVEEVSGGYEVYIVNSFATIIYFITDILEEEYEGSEIDYSGIVDFISCEITPFTADTNTEYYVDQLRKYIKRCELVANILNSIDVYDDPNERIYF